MQEHEDILILYNYSDSACSFTILTSQQIFPFTTIQIYPPSVNIQEFFEVVKTNHFFFEKSKFLSHQKLVTGIGETYLTKSWKVITIEANIPQIRNATLCIKCKMINI